MTVCHGYHLLLILPDILTGTTLATNHILKGACPTFKFMSNQYRSTAGTLRAVAIAISDDDSDSDGEYYSLNEYSAACLVR
jgi:hypothetical protein